MCKVKIALTFTIAIAIMPLIVLLIGQLLGQSIGHWTSIIGVVLFIGIGIYLIFFEDEDKEEEKLEPNLVGLILILTTLSISLNELAVGFSIGMIGIPILLSVFLIDFQAFVFTFIGLTFGLRIKPYLDKWAEKIAGIIVGLLGVWLLLESFVH
jgi:putative Mn2+ efflux pump MntP